RELEENIPSSANFEFNNLIPGFKNSEMSNSGSVGCGLSSLVDLEFPGFALGSDSASMLPGAISLCFKNVSSELKMFLTNTASARFRDVRPSAMSSDVSPGAISSGFQNVSAGAISSGFQYVLLYKQFLEN
ncbi:19905_t:CDS:2, partial [Gigaspora rosea]